MKPVKKSPYLTQGPLLVVELTCAIFRNRRIKSALKGIKSGSVYCSR